METSHCGQKGVRMLLLKQQEGSLDQIMDIWSLPTRKTLIDTGDC